MRDALLAVEPDLRDVVRRVGARACDRERLGLLARRLDEIGERLEGAVGSDDDRIRRVVEEIDRRDVLGLELCPRLERLQHDVRQVDADHRVAVAGHRIQLRPGECAAGTRLVDDDHLLLELRREDLRLQAGGDIRLAAGRERNDVLDGLVRIRERDRDREQREAGGEKAGQRRSHGGSLGRRRRF